ncbi:MAG: M1 family metallopeptidase [Flavobacteriales bacterium]
MLHAQKTTTYWQQRVDHVIEVKLDTARKMLLGETGILYHNNSPDALNKIYFHLYPNAYSSHETAFGKQLNRQGNASLYFAKEEQKGYMDSLNFTVNGKPVSYIIDPKNPDICYISLEKVLLPGQKLQILTSFRVKIPDCRFSRLGQCGNSYQITQWYPKPAVYDKDGWHPMPYLNFGEYYNQFGFYHVEITVPEGFGLGATGRRISGNHLRTISGESSWKTLVFEQDSVTDFAWFCDTEFDFITETDQLGNAHSYRAEVFHRNRPGWENAPGMIREAVQAYSSWVGPYPFAHATVVDGAITAGAGMEYPMITVIAHSEDQSSMDQVIAHEVGHNWFQMMLASNERRYPYLDEGLNSFYDNRYMRARYPDAGISIGGLPKWLSKNLQIDQLTLHNQYHYFYNVFARLNQDVPCNLPAERYSEINGGLIVYGKTAMALRNLQGWLGEQAFDRAMQQYFKEWSFKHPGPDDFRKSITQSTGQSLDWFFDDLLQTRKKTDYAIRRVNYRKDNPYVVVKNTGHVKSPFPITGVKGDSTLTLWYDGIEGMQRLSFPTYDFDEIIIDRDCYTLDVNRANNVYRRNKLFKSMPRMHWRFLTSMNQPGENPQYFIPVMGWNRYNGFMLGVKLHNIAMMERNLEYNFTPLYSFAQKDMAGMAQVHYHIKPLNGPIRKITLGADFATFATGELGKFRKLSPSIRIHPHKQNDDSPISQEILLRRVQILRAQHTTFDILNNDFASDFSVNQIQWRMSNSRAIQPFSILTSVEQSETFVKAQTELKYRIQYISKKKGLDLRFFAGSFLYTDPDLNKVPDVRFRLSGQNGAQDYLFDGIYLGRFENQGIWARQFTVTDGGFKELSFRGQTYNYILALNLKASLPGKLPIRLYADFGHYENGETDRDLIAYGAGAVLSIIPDEFEIYFPAIVSPAIKKTLETNNISYAQRIRFVMNLHHLNLFRVMKNFKI